MWRPGNLFDILLYKADVTLYLFSLVIFGEEHNLVLKFLCPLYFKSLFSSPSLRILQRSRFLLDLLTVRDDLLHTLRFPICSIHFFPRKDGSNRPHYRKMYSSIALSIRFPRTILLYNNRVYMYVWCTLWQLAKSLSRL